MMCPVCSWVQQATALPLDCSISSKCVVGGVAGPPQYQQPGVCVHQAQLNNLRVCWLHCKPACCCAQIEHHLFPAISFMHYPAIAKIVADESKKRGINVSSRSA